MNKDISIILTGTIKPNTNLYTKVISINERRNDYLKSIKYYLKYAPVFFLENSEYDLLNDTNFTKLKNLYIYKQPPSKFYSKGKGFQEFELMDNFIKTKNAPKDFIKITGRYIFEDFHKIYNECIHTDKDMLIDVFSKSQWAITYLFFCKKEIYLKYLCGIYKEMDDTDFDHYGAERVFFRHIFNNKNINYRMFLTECNILGTSGASAKPYPIKSKFRLKRRILRRKFKYYILKKNYLR